MSKEQLLRLKALLALDTKSATASEKKELGELTAAAKAANIDLDKLDDAISASSEMTEDDLREIVGKSVSEAMAKHKSASVEELAEVVTGVLATKGLTEDKIRSIVGELVSERTRTPSRMEFSVGEVEFPIESRAGNLTIAQKQLLNICLKSVSEDALADLGTKRPRDMNEGIPEGMLRKIKAASDIAAVSIRQGRKALAIGDYSNGAFSGTGGALAYVDLATDLLQRLYLKSQLATELMAREIAMPTDPFKLPIKTVRTKFSVLGESAIPAGGSSLAEYLAAGTSGTPSNPTLSALTLDAKKFIGYGAYSYESNEDAVIAILPMLQQDLGDSAAAAFESAILNGDTTGTHMDTAYAFGATTPEAQWLGLRKLTIGASGTALYTHVSGVASTYTAQFLTARRAMGKWGVAPGDLCIIASPEAYLRLMSSPDVYRYDGRGNAANSAVNSGELPQFNGIRVVVSEQLYPVVGSTGLRTSGGTFNADTAVLVNMTQLLVGTRRGFTVETTSDPLVQTNYVVASFRRAFTVKEATVSTTYPIAYTLGFSGALA